MKKYILYLFIVTASLFSCSDLLEEEVFINVGSNNFFQSDEDAINAVYGLYGKFRSDGPVTDNNQKGDRESWGFFGYGEGSIFNFSEANTDELYVIWAKDGGYWKYLVEFSWLPNSGSHFDAIFADLYEGIAIANNILENINSDGISKEVQDQVMGEALYARGLFYATLYSFYRNVPLIKEVVKDPLDEPVQAKPEEIAQFVIKDLTDAAALLPDVWPDEYYGRFTKGAAWATLARFQLNQGNWQAAIDAANEVLDLGIYELSPGYADAFKVDNSGNPEIILSIPCIAQPGIGNTFIAHTAEANYVAGGWGGHLMRKEFYNTFDPEDTRRSYMIKNYISNSGVADSVTDGYMIMKYEVDRGRVGAWAGNDIVLHRLPEVLLTKAEAMNELEGPTQDAIDLINDLRDRAFEGNSAKLLQPGDFTKETLRDHILAERGWELYMEGFRRDDLIRHGKFISSAQDRGYSASDYHVLYPIPQTEMDKNTKLIQNDGYEE